MPAARRTAASRSASFRCARERRVVPPRKRRTCGASAFRGSRRRFHLRPLPGIILRSTPPLQAVHGSATSGAASFHCGRDRRVVPPRKRRVCGASAFRGSRRRFHFRPSPGITLRSTPPPQAVHGSVAPEAPSFQCGRDRRRSSRPGCAVHAAHSLPAARAAGLSPGRRRSPRCCGRCPWPGTAPRRRARTSPANTARRHTWPHRARW